MKHYLAVLVPRGDSGWRAHFPDFPGCRAAAPTVEAALPLQLRRSMRAGSKLRAYRCRTRRPTKKFGITATVGQPSEALTGLMLWQAWRSFRLRNNVINSYVTCLGTYCHDLLASSPFGTGRHLIQATPGTLRRLQAPTDLRRCHHEDRDSNNDEPRTQNGVAAVGALAEHIIVAGYRRHASSP